VALVLAHATIEVLKSPFPKIFIHEFLLVKNWFNLQKSHEPHIVLFLEQQQLVADTKTKLFRLDRYEQFLWFNKIVKWLYEYSHSHKNSINNCLDIGCGYATLSLFCQKIFNCSVTGTFLKTQGDYLNSEHLRALSTKKMMTFHAHDIELDSTDHWKHSFDIILLTEVMEHLNYNPVPTLRKIREMLAANGRLYISTPDRNTWGRKTKYFQLWKDMPNPSQNIPRISEDGSVHIYHYTKEELEKIAELAGFSINKHEFSSGGVNGRHHNLELIKKED